MYYKTSLFNGMTWDSSSGGPMSARYEHGATPIPVRTGNDKYARGTPLVDFECPVVLTVAYVSPALSIGIKSNLVLTLETVQGTVAVSFLNMKLFRITHAQNRAFPGAMDLHLVHESADGQTFPIGVSGTSSYSGVSGYSGN
jgi:hypothetical protein